MGFHEEEGFQLQLFLLKALVAVDGALAADDEALAAVDKALAAVDEALAAVNSVTVD